MAHTPDMATQVTLFVLRSRARTADIQRRSTMNGALDVEELTRHRISADGWERCLLREGPRQAEEIMQLWCVLQARISVFQQLSDDQVVVDAHVKSLHADEDLKASVDKWFESAVFHDTIRSIQLKGLSGKVPPLLLKSNELFKQGRDQIVGILTRELRSDAETAYEYMQLDFELEAQAKRNRVAHLRYVKSLWLDQVAYARAIKSIAEAAEDADTPLRIDQAFGAAYERAISQPSLTDVMVKAYASLCADTSYGAHVFAEGKQL